MVDLKTMTKTTQTKTAQAQKKEDLKNKLRVWIPRPVFKKPFPTGGGIETYKGWADLLDAIEKGGE